MFYALEHKVLPLLPHWLSTVGAQSSEGHLGFTLSYWVVWRSVPSAFPPPFDLFCGGSPLEVSVGQEGPLPSPLLPVRPVNFYTLLLTACNFLFCSISLPAAFLIS